MVITCLLGITIIVVFVTISVVLYFKWAFSYWKKLNVPEIKPSIPFGSIPNLITNHENMGINLKFAYDEAVSKDYKYVGAYTITTPRLIITCPTIIKHVLQTDFDHFTDRGFYHNKKDDPLSANLFTVGGEEWRRVRSFLSPAFTTGKLRVMFPMLLKCGEDLLSATDRIYHNKLSIDAKDLALCYTINVISSCGFGIECNCFTGGTEFEYQAKKVFDFSSVFRVVKTAFAMSYPNLARYIGIGLFDTDSINFFVNLTKQTIEFRKKFNVVRHDALYSIMKLSSSLIENITELAAQIFIFFVAGFETSSTALTLCLYELALNHNIQEKLRAEMKTVLSRSNSITYDGISELKYMDQVIKETLRKYPSVSFISRECTKDYRIPTTSTVIKKGINVDISILGIHHNPKYYPSPQQFDPERFSADYKRKSRSPTYLPFGGGPRTCIGSRFGVLEFKVALIMLLSNYKFSLNKNTQEPIKFEKIGFVLKPRTPILLNADSIETKS